MTGVAAVALVALCYAVVLAYLPKARDLILWIAFPLPMLLAKVPATRKWAAIAAGLCLVGVLVLVLATKKQREMGFDPDAYLRSKATRSTESASSP